MIKQRNVFKYEKGMNDMTKRGVGVTLDIDVVEAIKDLQNNSSGTKFSTLVNPLLREHPEIKKRLKKNGKNKY